MWFARDPSELLEVPTIEELRAELLARPEWHRQAACRGTDVSLFFIGRGKSTQPAQSMCAACPARFECADAGAGEQFGIWGGQAPRERRRHRVAA